MDMHIFQQNRANFPPDKLAQFVGQYVAWNPEGTGILASDVDQVALENAVRSAGYDPSDILVSFVPNPNESNVGGGGLAT